MRLRGRTLHVAGWTGPLVEDAEPDLVDGLGAVDDGLNWMARDGAKRIIRGGSASVLSLAAVSGQNISDVLGLWPWTPTGAFALAHAVTGSKHYGYALTDTPAFALPVGAATEADSRLDLGWNSATPARPHAVELFEKLYIVDATEATTRQGMLSVSLSGGVLAVSTPTYDLDNSGGSPGALKGFAAEVYNGVLFVSGYDNETAANSGTAPHLLRHSLLGTDPASASGFHPDAYAIIGAKGQWIRALRAGRTSLLVAKEHELYKVYGQGRALGGWQYQIQQVNQTLGVGCTNPYALDHAFGMWYGIGRSGPWRSDGETVELLRAGRDRSWSKVDKLHLAQVRFYPERRQMVFAVYITGQPTYAVAPFEYWTWDMARDQWDVNQRYKRSFHMVNPVVQGATSAPSGIPGVPVQDFTYSANVMGLHNLTTIVWGEFSFNAADLTAETEVWTRTASGTSALQTTLNAGITRVHLDLLGSNQPTYVKLRHKRGALFSDFSGETPIYPPHLAPDLTVGWDGTTDFIPHPSLAMVSQASPAHIPARTLNITSDGATFSQTYVSDTGVQHTDRETTVPLSEVYHAQTVNAAWPSAVQNSPIVDAYYAGSTSLARPAQVFYPLPNDGTTIKAKVWPYRHGQTYRLEYRTPAGSGSYTAGAETFASSANGTALTPFTFTLSGLAAGTAYGVRAFEVSSGTPLAEVTMYTPLPAPTVTATTSGAGTPVVNVAVNNPIAGKTIRVYNKDRSYDQQHTNQPSGVNNYASTVGTCGVRDVYFARLVDTSFPAHMKFSLPGSDEIVNPCAVGS
jgi:hypothetical protein